MEQAILLDMCAPRVNGRMLRETTHKQRLGRGPLSRRVAMARSSCLMKCLNQRTHKYGSVPSAFEASWMHAQTVLHSVLCRCLRCIFNCMFPNKSFTWLACTCWGLEPSARGTNWRGTA